MLLFTKSRLLMVCTLLCCLLSTTLSYAQDEVNTTFNDRMNYVFG